MKKLLMAAAIAALTGPAIGQTVIYRVDDSNNSGPYNGVSWSTAYKYIQDALDVADSDDEIWVAEGD